MINVVYFGPPIGMYSEQGFDKFVNEDVLEWMRVNEIPNRLNIESGDRLRIYHFPEAGVGLEHKIYPDGNRCKVQIMYTNLRADSFNGLFHFIMRTEQQDKLRVLEE